MKLAVPQFRGIEKELLFPGILLSVRHAQQTLKRMSRYYIEVLGGKPDVQFERQNLLNMLFHMENLNVSTLKNSLEAKIIDRNALSVEVKNVYIDSTWEMVVKVTAEQYCMMFVEFLGKLKQKRSKTYELVRDALHLLNKCDFSPVTMLDQYYERYDDVYFQEMIDDGSEDWVQQMTQVRDKFQRHIIGTKHIPDKKLKLIAKEVRKRCKTNRSLTLVQRAWIEDILTVYDLSVSLKKGGLRFMDYENLEKIFDPYEIENACYLEDFFTVLWSGRDSLSDFFQEDMHQKAQSDFRLPFVAFRISDRKDYDLVMKFVNFLSRLQEILYKCEVYWQ